MTKRTQNDIMQNWPNEYNQPLVSVRCATYNHEKYIAQALDSFLMQDTNFPFEIVVHDDASTDKTADIIREYEAKYPKIIKPIYETENQFSKHDGSLRKILNNACKGKYIAYCEGDDFWCDSHKLQKQYEALEEHPECSLCTHIVQAVSEEGFPIERQDPPPNFFQPSIIDQFSLVKKIIAKHTHPLQTSSYFLRKTILLENNVFFNFPGNGDEKILRLCIKEGKFFFISSIMSCYRYESIGSWTSRTVHNKSKYTNLLSNTIKLNNLFDEFSDYKFHQYIEMGNRRIRFEMILHERLFKKLLATQNKDLLKDLGTKQRFFYKALAIMPTILARIIYSSLSYYAKLKKLFYK